MSSTTVAAAPAAAVRVPSFGDRLRADPAFQAFMLLRVAFAVAPILFGLDKFFNVMVDWPIYLAPWINDVVPGSGADAMHMVGVDRDRRRRPGRGQAALRRLSGRRLARRDHRQPAHALAATTTSPCATSA